MSRAAIKRSIIAALPENIAGHFGPELRRFAQHPVLPVQAIRYQRQCWPLEEAPAIFAIE